MDVSNVEFTDGRLKKFNQADDDKAKTGEVGLAGMGGSPLPPNSQKAEFT
jgi:hypothetical protein